MMSPPSYLNMHTRIGCRFPKLSKFRTKISHDYTCIVFIFCNINILYYLYYSLILYTIVFIFFINLL